MTSGSRSGAKATRGGASTKREEEDGQFVKVNSFHAYLRTVKPVRLLGGTVSLVGGAYCSAKLLLFSEKCSTSFLFFFVFYILTPSHKMNSWLTRPDFPQGEVIYCSLFDFSRLSHTLLPFLFFFFLICRTFPLSTECQMSPLQHNELHCHNRLFSLFYRSH